MSTLTKRVTVYLDPSIHEILKVKSLESSKSVSEIINGAILHELGEDSEDFIAFEERAQERTISFEALLQDFEINGV